MEPLFLPFRHGSLHLRNRIAMAPMTREFSPGGVPASGMADYYGARAEGGTGLIITEGVAVNRTGRHSPKVPRFFGEDALAAWKPVVAAVHAAGSAIMPQLWHVGIQIAPVTDPADMIRQLGPSGLNGLGDPAGAPMTQAEIDATIADFGAAAAAARRLGCDGIELHGAHGYLLDQFFWSQTNRRDDAYGGDPLARTRFAVEVVAECRRQAGADFPILLRFSQWKTSAFEAKLAETPQELERLLRPLVDAGVDMFHCSTRRFDAPAFGGSPQNLATRTKKLTGKPTIAVGSVTLERDFKAEAKGHTSSAVDLATLEAVAEGIGRGDFDLVAIGRALISNPDWAEKVRRGEAAQLAAFSKEHLRTLR